MPKNKTYNHAATGAFALFGLATIYGFIGYFAREIAPGLTLMQQMYMRLLLATPFFWLIFRKQISFKSLNNLMHDEPKLVVVRAILLYALPVPIFIYSTLHAKLANVAFLQILPYTFVMGALVNKEKMTKQKVGLMLVALFGASLITLKGGLDLSAFGRGEIASIVSGIIFSLGYVSRKKHKTKANDYEISFAIVCISTILCFLASMLLREGWPHSTVAPLRLSILLVVVSLVNVFIILLANYGFRYVRDSFANNILALEGFFALIFGYLIYQEVPAGQEVIGAIIILGSAVCSAYLVKSSD